MARAKRGPYNVKSVLTDFGHAIMHPALKFSLDGFELRDHSLLRSNPPDDESSGRELPTVVGETQECEGLGFSLAPPLPISSGEPPEFDQPCLVRM